MTISGFLIFTVGILSLSPTTVSAADESVKCDAGKLKAGGRYYDCRMKAESQARRRNMPPDFSNCDRKLDTVWIQLESKYAGDCSVAGDFEIARASMASDTTELTATFAGEGVPLCGDGITNSREQCDGNDLRDASCISLGFTIGGDLGCTPNCSYNTSGCESQSLSVTGQISSHTPADDGDLQIGTPFRFIDNGDGTISDRNTGLMWEKQVWDGGLHDVTRQYNWEEAFEFVEELNAAHFGGYSDWRLPNKRELETIVDAGRVDPCVDPAFDTDCTVGCTTSMCSCTMTAGYWSSTSYAGDSEFTWYLSFGGGFENLVFKLESGFLRVVRSNR